MSKWKETTLSEFIDFGNGKKKPNSEGLIPIYGGNGILGFCNESNYKDETIIIGRVGAYCGSVYYENREVWISDNALSAKAKNNNNTKFLYYFLKNSNLNQYAGGSSHPLVTQTLLNSLEFNICSDQNEQKAIAEVLSSLDDKIDLLHRQNKTLEQMAETLFRQWFVEEKEEVLSLLDFIEINPKESITRGEFAPYLEMKNVKTDDASPLSWYNREFKSGTKFKNGDTLLARITPCLQNGKKAFIQFLDDDETGWGSTEFLVFRTKQNYHPFCSYLLAKNESFKAYAVKTMTGSSGRQRVQTDSLKQFKLYKPSNDKILELNNIFEDVANKLKINAAQISTLKTLRDTLLPNLMSGEIKVVAND